MMSTEESSPEDSISYTTSILEVILENTSQSLTIGLDETLQYTTVQPTEYYDEVDEYRVAIDYTYFYLLAFIIWLGLFFNVLALVCFLTSRTLRATTTGHYLIALTSADIIYLTGDALRWLNSLLDNEPVMNITFMDDYNFWCKTIFFLRYFGKLVSAWITVAITLERYISVGYPLKAGQISTKRNAAIIILGTYITCACLTSFPLWTIGIKTDEHFTYCTYINQNEYNIWNWIMNRVGSLFIPSIILFVVTAMIVYQLYKIGKQRKSLMITVGVNTNLERQLTFMLIAVSVTFLLLRLPYTLTYYLHDFRTTIWKPLSQEVEQQLWTALKFTDVLATSNYAINFFLYCLAGGAFRSQLVALICCKRRALNRGKSVSTQHTLSTSIRSLNKLSPVPKRITINNNGHKF